MDSPSVVVPFCQLVTVRSKHQALSLSMATKRVGLRVPSCHYFFHLIDLCHHRITLSYAINISHVSKGNQSNSWPNFFVGYKQLSSIIPCYPIVSWVSSCLNQWIGFREKLQERPLNSLENLWFPVDFPANRWLNLPGQTNHDCSESQVMKCRDGTVNVTGTSALHAPHIRLQNDMRGFTWKYPNSWMV